MNKTGPIAFIAILLSFLQMSAQTVQFTNINADDFPIIRGQYYTFYKDWTRYDSLYSEDVRISENGTEREIIGMSCPPLVIERTSVAMSIDVSGSMNFEEEYRKRIDCGKLSAEVIIDGLPIPPWELSLQVCGSYPVLINDYTQVKEEVVKQLDDIIADGRNNFPDHLLDKDFGLLSIAARGSFKKAAVLYTDAYWKRLPKKIVDSCIQFCLDNDIKFYALIYSDDYKKEGGIFDDLAKIANSSGGMLLTDIRTEASARYAAQKLIGALKFDPCDISWKSGYKCDSYPVDLEIEVKKLDVKEEFTYVYPEDKRMSLEFAPSAIMFKNVPEGESADSTIEVTALNGDFNVLNIISDNESFSITPSEFLIKAGESKALTIHYESQASGYQRAKFQIENDQCPAGYGASAYRIGTIEIAGDLKVVYPNGGEKFVAGGRENISWEGISEKDIVALDVSLDNGQTWRTIRDTSSGLNYDWRSIPKEESDDCLMRARHLIPEDKMMDDRVFAGQSRTSYSANCLAWSPDGKYLACGGVDGSIGLWIPDSAKMINVIMAHKKSVNSISWAPDGNRIVSSSDDKTIRVWDLTNNALIKELINGDDAVKTAQWSPDGKYIACGLENDTLTIFNSEDWSILDEMKCDLLGVKILAWSPDSKYIAIGGGDIIILLYNIEKAKITDTIEGHSSIIADLSWSPDGKYIASSGADRNLKIWKADTKEIYQNYHHDYAIGNLSWAPDSKRLLANSYKPYLLIWDIDSADIVMSIWDYKPWYPCFNPKENTFAGMFYYDIALWDADEGKILKRFNAIPHSTDYLFWSPISDRIVQKSYSSSSIINPFTGFTLNTFKLGTLLKNSVSSDASFFIEKNFWHKVNVRDIINGDTISIFPTDHNIQNACWSADSKYFACLCKSGTLFVYDFEAGDSIYTSTVLDTTTEEILWSPDGNYISAYDGQKVIIVNAKTGKKKNLIAINEDITAMLWGYNPNELLVGDKVGTIRILDVETKETIRSWQAHGAQISSLAMGLNPGILLSASYETDIKVWDPRSATLLDVLKGHTMSVKSLACNKYATLAVSGSLDKTLRIWNIDKAKTLQEDVSDSVWSIIIPELASHDIDMGTLIYGGSKDTLLTDFLYNVSNAPIRIDSILLVSDAFFHVSGIPPFTIEPGKKRSVEFNFTPPAPGDYSAEILIYTQADSLTQKIIGSAIEAKLEIITKKIDFGEVDVDKYKDTVVAAIRNNSATEAKVKSTFITGPDTDMFDIISGGGNFALPPGGEREMTLRFSPGKIGLANALLYFVNENGDYFRVCLLGEGIEGEKECYDTEFEYPDFSDIDKLNFVGDASHGDKQVHLTSAWENKAGALWRENKVHVNQGFVTDFQFKITEGDNLNSDDGSYPGADGLAFVIQNSSPEAIGLDGGGIGYSSIEKAIAIEFDMYENGKNQIENLFDKSGNHIAVQSGGLNAISSYHEESSMLGYSENIIEFRSNGIVYNAKIEYDGDNHELKVYFDTLETLNYPVLTVEDIYLDELLGLEDGLSAYIGFTSATGNAVERHNLLNWKFCPDTIVKVSVLDFPNSKPGINVYPNPAASVINIELRTAEPGELEIRLYNIFGVEIYSINDYADTQRVKNYKIDCSALPPGAYYIEFNNSGRRNMKKITILR